MNFDMKSILTRTSGNLKSPVTRMEGGFTMDNLRAVAAEMAKLYDMEILPIPDNFSLETACGEYLDRKGNDLQEPRKEGEEDEPYRVRLLEKVRRPITGGNENYYIYLAKQVEGVGNARCTGCWNGPGTVKVVVLSGGFDVPDETVLQAAREHILSNRMIGAEVTVSAAVPLEIRVEASLRVGIGYAVETVRLGIARALEEYLTGISFTDRSPMSYHRTGELMFHVDGVEDVLSYTLNGGTASLSVGMDEFFQLKGVVIHAVD